MKDQPRIFEATPELRYYRYGRNPNLVVSAQFRMALQQKWIEVLPSTNYQTDPDFEWRDVPVVSE